MPTNQSESLKVLVRCRPLNGKELKARSTKCIEIQGNDALNACCSTIKLFSPRNARRKISRVFRFDAIYDETQRTEQIFIDSLRPLIFDVVSFGFSGTIFAYGQTGSGYNENQNFLLHKNRAQTNFRFMSRPIAFWQGYFRNRFFYSSKSKTKASFQYSERLRLDSKVLSRYIT